MATVGKKWKPVKFYLKWKTNKIFPTKKVTRLKKMQLEDAKCLKTQKVGSDVKYCFFTNYAHCMWVEIPSSSLTISRPMTIMIIGIIVVIIIVKHEDNLVPSI